MDIAQANLAHALGKIDPASNVCLVLPFTPSLLLDPTPLLPTIYQTVVAVPTSHIVVRLVRPSSTRGPADEQLYDILRQNPRANWDVLQRFLAELYASLSAGQWACGKVLLDVEVAFAQASDQGISREYDAVLYLDGYETLLPSDLPSHLPTHALPSPSFPSSSSSYTPPSPSVGPDVVALGGTFDHLHAAHKLLLHLAHFLARRKVIVGVMSDSLLSNKSHNQFLQPISERIATVRKFMEGLALESGIQLDIVEIFDPFGPTQDDPDIQALVISEETRSGGQAVNDRRKEKGLGELEVWCIGVISAGKSGLQPAPGVGGAAREERGERTGYPGEIEDGTSMGSGILKGMDEKTLKEVKMGSTAVRKWLSEGGDRR